MRPPMTLDDAYRMWFDATAEVDATAEADAGTTTGTHADIRRLLSVVLAAREPLSSAHLEQLGLADACEALPGWGLLFESREHLLQTVHLSLREWALDRGRSGEHWVDVREGQRQLARSCVGILRGGGAGPLLDYALRYGHVHLREVVAVGESAAAGAAGAVGESAAAGAVGESAAAASKPEAPAAEAMQIVGEWSDAFLEPRRTADRSLAGGYALSRTSARELVSEWLEQQAQRGRSRRLVPELLALEGPWWPSSCFLATS